MIQRAEVVNAISKTGIIPLLTSKEIDVAISLVDIICESGCKIIEYGIRNSNSLENYSLLRRYIDSKYEDVFFGAGSVTEKEIAQKIIDIGADFIIGPGFSESVLKQCKGENVLYIPGCASASEIIKARELGIFYFKIFPASFLGGYQYLKSLKSAMPWLRAIPAGGIKSNPLEIRKWFDAGAEAITIGSDLFGKHNDKENLKDLKSDLMLILKEIKQLKIKKHE